MWFYAIASALSLASGLTQYNAFKTGGKYAKREGEYAETLAGRRAEGMEMQAGQERAAAQRTAIDQRRMGDIIESRATALGAASGAGVSDPTVTNILSDIDRESELRALTALYQGEESARGLEYGAELARAGGAGEAWAGKVQRKLTNAQANAALLSGISQASVYGAKGYSSIGETGNPMHDKYAIDETPGQFKWQQTAGGLRKYY